MPRLKKTDAQRRADRFGEHYRVGKARLRLHEPEIAAALGLGESTLRKYKRNPDLFSMGQLVRLGRVLGWSDAEYLDIIHTGMGRAAGALHPNAKEVPMKKEFTFEDYREALKGVGPRTRENILERAINDRNIEFQDFLRLCKLAYPEPV